MSTAPIENSPAGNRPATASWAFLAVGVVVTLAHWLGVLGTLDQATYSLLVLAGFVATIVGILRNRPTVRWPFVCFAVCVFLFFVGGATRTAWHTLADLSTHRSLVPDIITMPGYVLLAVGLFGLGRRRMSGVREVDTLVDASMAGLSALAFGWVFLIAPTLAATHARVAVRLVLASYPPLSVFVLVAGFLLVASGGKQRPIALRLLQGALVFLLIGDLIYTCVDARVASLPASVTDVPYLLANVLFAAMHLHPSSRQLCEPVPRHERPPSRIRIAFVAVALGVPAIIVMGRPALVSSDRLILIVVIGLLTTAATWRVFTALRSSAQYEQQLEHQATHDHLTGLPNRSYVHARLRQALERRADTGAGVAVLFLDLDRFKHINDALGHGVGDRLLVAVARRLRRVAPSASVVSRIAGDEFAVVLERLTEDESLDVARYVHASFALPFDADGTELSTTVSIGIVYAQAGQPVEEEALLRDADIAMYEAKDRGRDCVAVFNAEIHQRTARRLVLERDIRHSLRDEQLSLHYQPIIDVPTRRVVGVEALLRWHHPKLGLVSPLDFIPVAEETGIIVDIGQWVMRTACRQLDAWRREHPQFANIYASVNVSGRQLRDDTFVGAVAETLASNGLRANDLYVELTESVLVEHSTAARGFLDGLRTLGVSIAIDDFGTGYSSLSYLRTFHVDVVKIDKSFVDHIGPHDTVDESLVAAIVAIARALDVDTVAEGVEKTEQADRLKDLGVDSAQGYLFSRPVPAEDVPGAVARLNQLAVRETSRVEHEVA
jgi:diguanylate cyclase (GGDEF)-like protein